MRRFAIASMFLLTLTLRAQQLPFAADITKQVQEAQKQRKSVEYTRELTGEFTLDGKPVTEVLSAGRRIPVASAIGKQTVSLQNPGKARIDLQLGAGNLMVTDGETSWTYRPSTKLYTKISAARTPDGVAADLAVLDVIGFFADVKNAKTTGEETITVDGKTYDCWVITTTSLKMPAQAALGGQLSGGTMTSWIDKKLLIEVKEEITYSIKTSQTAGAAPVEYKSKITQLTKALKVDQPVAADLFAWLPPADAKEQPANAAGNRVDLTGKDAPAFRGVSLDGKVYSSADLKGKVVLLDFWATWCGPCKRSMPITEKLYEDYKSKGFLVLGIDVGEKRDVVEKFMATSPFNYPVIMGDEAGMTTAYAVNLFPTFVLIGADGKVASHQFGFNESALNSIPAMVGLNK
jgi:thiol-disulfide isomerase/thioredoxin